MGAVVIDAVKPSDVEVAVPYAGFVVKFDNGAVRVIAVLASSTPSCVVFAVFATDVIVLTLVPDHVFILTPSTVKTVSDELLGKLFAII